MKWKLLSRVRLFTAPRTIQSTEFSRPEHWSGQPFPSPADLPDQELNQGHLNCRQILYQLSHQGWWNYSINWGFCFPIFVKSGASPLDLPNPGMEHRSPALQEDSVPAEPPGKPKNTGVGSLPFSSPGMEPRSPALQVDSTSWAAGEGDTWTPFFPSYSFRKSHMSSLLLAYPISGSALLRFPG